MISALRTNEQQNNYQQSTKSTVKLDCTRYFHRLNHTMQSDFLWSLGQRFLPNVALEKLTRAAFFIEFIEVSSRPQCLQDLLFIATAQSFILAIWKRDISIAVILICEFN